MNRLPDPTPAELAAEAQMQARSGPNDPELAADWRLRRELHELGTPALPDAMRRRVMRAAAPAGPKWWMGIAAAVVLAVAVSLVLQPTGPASHSPTVSEAELQQLNTALAALEYSARRTSAIAGRQVTSSIHLPELNLDRLPYAPELRHWIEPARPTEI